MVTLFASTPCYGGMCLQAYAESMLRLQRACAANGFQMMLDTTENESLVHRARNISVARFMQKSNATHFLFIDADEELTPQGRESIVREMRASNVIAYRFPMVDVGREDEGEIGRAHV